RNIGSKANQAACIPSASKAMTPSLSWLAPQHIYYQGYLLIFIIPDVAGVGEARLYVKTYG
ncbi:MAG: hypothetical protein ACHQAX_07980, partial [Gammaproteobacteria bacterium]